jgi:hypothetical protein
MQHHKGSMVALSCITGLWQCYLLLARFVLGSIHLTIQAWHAGCLLESACRMWCCYSQGGQARPGWQFCMAAGGRTAGCCCSLCYSVDCRERRLLHCHSIAQCLPSRCACVS